MSDAGASVLIERLRSAKKIVLLTHLNPDADTLCSAMALYDWLFRQQKKAFIFNAGSEIAPYLDALHYREKVVHTWPEGCDVAVAFDCGDFNRLGIKSLDIPLINIDHHLSNEGYGSLNYVDTKCVSTTQVLYNILIQSKQKISDVAASLLYIGLVSDSRSFGTDRVDAAVFRMAADLVEKGADAEVAHKLLFQSQSLARVRLIEQMLSNLELCCDAQVAVAWADAKMFETTGALRTDTEVVLDLLLSMKVVEVALVLRETQEAATKVSLRSKGLVDVNRLAESFGGGGHKRASGFESDQSLASCKQELLHILKKEFLS